MLSDTSSGVPVYCEDCRQTVTLPPMEGRPGFVSIGPLTGWTAPPLRCPECSANAKSEADR